MVQIIYTYKRVVCVCLSVCLLFISHTTFVHFAALPPRAGEQEPSRAAPRARGQACTARARARMPYNFSTKKSYADAFQKQNRTRAHAVVQFAPLLIILIDVFLNQVTSVVLISLYFIHFITIYIVIRPLIQSHL